MGKQFLSKQQSLHEKCENILWMLGNCIDQLNVLKARLEDYDCGNMYTRMYNTRQGLLAQIEWKRKVLNRVSGYYTSHILKLMPLDSAIAHNLITVSNTPVHALN